MLTNAFTRSLRDNSVRPSSARRCSALIKSARKSGTVLPPGSLGKTGVVSFRNRPAICHVSSVRFLPLRLGSADTWSTRYCSTSRINFGGIGGAVDCKAPWQSILPLLTSADRFIQNVRSSRAEISPRQSS